MAKGNHNSMISIHGKHFGYISGKKYDSMMGRCYRVKDPSYIRYGRRGIAICSAWIKDINQFRFWLLLELERIGLPVEKFVAESKHYELDRINSDGHYTPSNCRIVSTQQNSRNRKGCLRTFRSAEGEVITV
jgi:hypothetical protein